MVDVLGNFDDRALDRLQLQALQCDNLADSILEVKNILAKKDRSNVPEIIVLKTGDPATAADYFSSVIWEIGGGTLVLDEVDSIAIKEGSCFDQYIRYGRNHSGDLLTGCRRPAELHRNVTAAANKFYCFQTHEMRDIEYFYSIFGDRAEDLHKIPRYHGLFMDYDNEITGVFKTDESGLIYHVKVSSLTASPEALETVTLPQVEELEPVDET